MTNTKVKWTFVYCLRLTWKLWKIQSFKELKNLPQKSECADNQAVNCVLWIFSCSYVNAGSCRSICTGRPRQCLLGSDKVLVSLKFGKPRRIRPQYHTHFFYTLLKFLSYRETGLWEEEGEWEEKAIIHPQCSQPLPPLSIVCVLKIMFWIIFFLEGTDLCPRVVYTSVPTNEIRVYFVKIGPLKGATLTGWNRQMNGSFLRLWVFMHHVQLQSPS